MLNLKIFIIVSEKIFRSEDLRHSIREDLQLFRSRRKNAANSAVNIAIVPQTFLPKENKRVLFPSQLLELFEFFATITFSVTHHCGRRLRRYEH